MKTVRQLEPDQFGDVPIVLAIGFFDGVHRGHQHVLKKTMQLAERIRGEAWVLTFDPHPLSIIRPEVAPRLLTSAEHKCLLFEEQGVDGCIVMQFNESLRSLSPEGFLELLASHIHGLQHIVVGENWTFGKGHRGNAETLTRQAAGLAIDTSIVHPVMWKGGVVSSTRVRGAVLEGNLADARDMLGRSFSVYGKVVHGHQVGRTLGFPTANVDPQNEVHLPDGIYAALTHLNGRACRAAAYIGSRPTFADEQWVVEVFLLEESADLYGKSIEISFISRIRDDRAFASMEELKTQIQKDVQAVNDALDTHAKT